MAKVKFCVQINKGPTQEIVTRSGLYILAAAAALDQLEYDEYPEAEGADIVKIWYPPVVDEYPPIFYAFHEGRIFHLVPAFNRELIW
jgi:hypothetical protein